VIGDVVVGLLYGLGVVMLERANALRLLGVPSFFLMPAAGGLVASYFWRQCKPTIGATIGYVVDNKNADIVPAWVAYVDEDNPGNINLCLIAGCKMGKGYLPQCQPRTNVPYDAGKAPFTWHFLGDE